MSSSGCICQHRSRFQHKFDNLTVYYHFYIYLCSSNYMSTKTRICQTPVKELPVLHSSSYYCAKVYNLQMSFRCVIHCIQYQIRDQNPAILSAGKLLLKAHCIIKDKQGRDVSRLNWSISISRVARGNGEFFDRMNKILQKQDSLLSAALTEVTTFFTSSRLNIFV